MNGKRAKQLRKAQGFTIHERRLRRDFERAVNTTIAQRSEQRARSRRLRRQVFAWAGIGVILAAIGAGLFL